MISTARHSINASDPYAEISEESGDGNDNAPLINPPIEGKKEFFVISKVNKYVYNTRQLSFIYMNTNYLYIFMLGNSTKSIYKAHVPCSVIAHRKQIRFISCLFK